MRRYKTDTPTRFTCHLDNTLDLSDVKRIVLKSVNIMNLFPNIGPQNNKFYFTVGGAPYVAEIPVGTYEAASFLTNLVAAITVTGATTCIGASYNATSFRVTLTCTDAFAALSVQDILTQYGVHDSLNFKVGVHPFTTSPEATSETYDGTIQLSGVTHIHVESQALASAHSADSTGHVRNVIAIVPIDSEFGAMQYWHPSNHMMAMVDYAGDRAINTIDISITDHVGNVLSLPSNAEVTIELMVVFDSF